MTAKLITDPVITEYVDRLGQTIVRNSDAQVPFTIKVNSFVLDHSVDDFILRAFGAKNRIQRTLWVPF